ncbi:AAA family ATPase [Aeoliella sp. SH292]|uniref:AAA family ATPase n=1 Tax=Aeoliella sp. SH292 TaxID=3454464 RepID=UPI003F983FC0
MSNEEYIAREGRQQQADYGEPEYIPPPIAKFTFAELREAYPELQPTIIDGLLRKGETCNVIASPKVGKSWFCYYVALCIIMGWSIFDRFATTRGRVLILDNELHRSTLAHRIPIVAQAMGVDPWGDDASWQEDLEVWPLRGDLRSTQELAFEFEHMEPGTFDAIIMDAKYRFALEGTSENDNASEARFYNLIDRFAEMTGAAFLLVHHSSKGAQSGKSVTDVGAGAGAQSRAADCHMVLREHEEPGHIVLDAAVRSFKPVSPLVLKWQFPLWVPAEGMDPGELKGTKGKQQEQWDAQNEATDKAVIKALVDGPATNRKLRETTGMGKDRVQRSLDRLKAAGHIDYTITEIRGNECHEYFIPNPPA